MRKLVLKMSASADGFCVSRTRLIIQPVVLGTGIALPGSASGKTDQDLKFNSFCNRSNRKYYSA